MRTIAQIISGLFHPLLMPVLGLYLIFNTDSYVNYAISSELKRAVLLLVATSTFIVPLLVSLLLVNRKIIQSLAMRTNKERIIPYALTIVFYIFTLYLLKKAPLPPVIFNFIIGATLSVILAFIINIKWKISAHMIGLGGLVGALISISLVLDVYITPYLILSLLSAGLVGSSRLILKAHNQLQVFFGFFLGVGCQLLVMLY